METKEKVQARPVKYDAESIAKLSDNELNDLMTQTADSRGKSEQGTDEFNDCSEILGLAQAESNRRQGI